MTRFQTAASAHAAGPEHSRIRTRLAATVLTLGALALAGCSTSPGAALPQNAGSLVAAFQPLSPVPATLRTRMEADRAQPRDGAAASIAPGGLYRSYRIETLGDALPASDAAALAALLADARTSARSDARSTPIRAVLLSLRPSVEGRALPELPAALLAIDGAGDARVFARWSYRLPPARDDLRIGLEWLARAAATDLAEARRAADAAARLGGMTIAPGAEGPRWMLAPLSDASVAALAGATDGALADAFTPAALIANPTAPARDTTSLALRLGPENEAGHEAPGGLSIALALDVARSRLEPLRDGATSAFAATAPGFGFVAPGGARLVEAARYLRLGSTVTADPPLAELLALDPAPATALATLAGNGRSGADAPATGAGGADQACAALAAYLRKDAALTAIDRVAAMIETLRESGQEAALFRSPACLPVEERPVACATGLLNCGSAQSALDESSAMKALTDYMRWPTRSRRAALAALLPDRMTVSRLDLATGADAGAAEPARERLSRDALLDRLAEARLNRYGEAARNPNDPDWWMANFTRRPALRQVLTVYAAFADERFDDLGFVMARVDDAALADDRSWARAQLGPLIAPCDRTESPPLAGGLVLTARHPLGDCAQFDDFAL